MVLYSGMRLENGTGLTTIRTEGGDGVGILGGVGGEGAARMWKVVVALNGKVLKALRWACCCRILSEGRKKNVVPSGTRRLLCGWALVLQVCRAEC